MAQLSDNEKAPDKIYRVMSTETANNFDNSFKILFCGDLILLEDQVKRGLKDDGYDFAEVFEYAAPYISAADFSIGVFEGPLGGTSKNFSQSNFNDGKELFHQLWIAVEWNGTLHCVHRYSPYFDCTKINTIKNYH